MPALIGEYGAISVPKIVKPGLTRPRTSQAMVNSAGPAMAPSAIQRAVRWGRIRGGLVQTNVSSVISVSLLGFGFRTCSPGDGHDWRLSIGDRGAKARRSGRVSGVGHGGGAALLARPAQVGQKFAGADGRQDGDAAAVDTDLAVPHGA